MITQKKLKKILNYNSETGIFTNKTTRSNRAIKNSIAGNIQKDGYVRIRINRKNYYAHRLAWLFVYGDMPTGHIDHINHNKADNRMINIRESTHQENCKNQSKRSDNTSGVVGVSWNKKRNRWEARIKIDGTNKFLGYFVNFHKAVNARKNHEVLYNYHENHGKK